MQAYTGKRTSWCKIIFKLNTPFWRFFFDFFLNFQITTSTKRNSRLRTCSLEGVSIYSNHVDGYWIKKISWMGNRRPNDLGWHKVELIKFWFLKFTYANEIKKNLRQTKQIWKRKFHPFLNKYLLCQFDIEQFIVSFTENESMKRWTSEHS